MYTRDMIVEVRPFSRQFEGEEVIIGRQETGTFLAVPAEAVDVLDCLGQGKTVGEASDLHQQKHGTIPDLDDFLSAMASSGIVRLPTSAPDENATLGEPRRVRYHLAHFPQALAQRIFSLPVLAVCCLLIAVAIGLTAWHPSLLPRVREFYFTDHRTLTLLVLVFIGYASVLVHEFAHLVAARAQGVNARLGISNRLWELVVEADLTGLWAVPKRRRYLPLLAGSLHDAVVGSVIVLLLFAQEQNLLASPAFLVRILRLSLLIYITRIGWQCFVFVRTDYYYVIASLLDCRNLLSDTEDFLCNQIARFIPWVPRVDQSALSAGEHRVLPAFAFVWAAGRIVALFWFYSVTGPILILYTLNLLRVFHAGYSANPSDFVDSVLLYLIMVVPIGVGLSLWIASLARRAGTVLSLQRA